MMPAEPQEIQLRTEGCAALRAISAAAGQTRELGKVLDVAVQVLEQMPGVHASCVHLRNADGWALAACRGTVAAVPPLSWFVETEHPGLEDVVTNRRAIVSHASPDVGSTASKAVQNWAAAPCLVEGTVRGIVWVGSQETQGLPTGIGELIEAVGNVLGMVIELSLIHI